MMHHTEITSTFSEGDYIQVVADEIPGIPGKLLEINESTIVMGPYDDEKMIEYYGEPTSSITMIPINTIRLLFKLNPDEAKNEQQ